MAITGTEKRFRRSRIEAEVLSLGGTDVTATAAELNAAADLTWAVTSASTNGSNSVEPLVLESEMTGAGGVGGRARFQLDTNVALGGWANALKGVTVFGSNGRVTGLASGIVGEIVLSAGTTQGTYAPIESEIVMPADAKTGTATSFFYGAVSGADKAEFDDKGFAFELAGLAIGGGNVIEAETGAVESTHSLRIRINGTAYYIPISTAQNFGSA